MLRILQKKGLASITEVVVTSIIFIISAIGIMSAITMVRPQAGGSNRDLEAAYLAKQQIDFLRGEIDPRMWKNSASSIFPGIPYENFYTDPTTGREYHIEWGVTDVPSMVVNGVSYLRMLEMNVTY